jgi:flagellar hook-associated protein 3 FlgL
MIFEGNINALNDKTAALLKTQQQMSSGKRILTPADDPVASAQVLELTQSAAINSQYQASQNTAKSNLGIIDGQLSSVSDLLLRVRELGVQAGNASLSTADRKSITTELRARFDELVGIANSKDGTGQYLFSGYQSTSKPFAGSVENGVSYAGDDGQRALQVSGSRQMPVSVTGNDLFMNIKNGNGIFATSAQTAASNTGSGLIDAGSVSDPAKWNSSANSGQLEVRFWKDPATATSYYDLVDATSGNSLYTGTPSATGAGGSYTHAYNSGNAISFSGLAAPYNDFGASVTITGTPASGDIFNVNNSTSTGLFSMLADMINTVELPTTIGAAGNTQRQNQLGAVLASLSQVEDNVSRVRSDVGSRLNELDDLESAAQGLDLQYKSRISDLESVDYNKAISDLTRQQTELQATQQSFTKIANMSLFDYL